MHKLCSIRGNSGHWETRRQLQKWQYPPSSIVGLVGDRRRTAAKHGFGEDIGKERAELGELQVEPCKLELQASQIQHIDHGIEDEMGGNVDDDDEEDSDILVVGDLSFGETPVKRLSSLGLTNAEMSFLWEIVHRDLKTPWQGPEMVFSDGEK